MDQVPQPRTCWLTERTASVCRLTRADVAFLLAAHPTHVGVRPTGRPSRYRLTPGHHVGTIVCPTCRLVIRPKVPVSNLFTLLDPAAPLPVVEDHSAAVPGAEGLEFLAARLANLLAERSRAGLHRAYAERAQEGPYLQGRLDLASQVREPVARKDRLHSRFADLTVDVPCNQVPRSTAELVLASPLLGERVRAALRHSLEAFADVSTVELSPERLAAALPDTGDRQSREAYRLLLELCRLLVEGLSPREAAGAVGGPAFLLDMERVFERYCTAVCVSAFSAPLIAGRGFTVAVQPLRQASQPAPGQPDLRMRPDVTIDRDGRPLLVVDAKWKRLPGLPLVTPDVYQVLAYGTALGVAEVVLVYPGRRDRCWEFRLTHAPLRLSIRTLRVVGLREQCERSARRLGRDLTTKAQRKR